MVGIGLGAQESLIQRRVDRRGAALEAIVVILCGLLGAAGFAYFALEMYSALEAPLPYTNYTLIGIVLGPMLTVFGIWVLYTVAAHLVANFLGGRGPISRALRVTGWAIMPIGVWMLLRSIVIVALFYSVDFPPSPEGISPEAQVQNVMELGLESPAYFATFLVGLVFVAWSWRLLAVGIENAKEVSRDKARKIAAVPAVIVGLYLLQSGLQWWTPF
ncbi:Yip1 domain-containing protein [Natronoarchaeum philippinense]|uniref:Yip1 domain-containing protein n=1 Tax=Natronoarchaeum philippinense TaxID=558529 RepID=A0A285P5R4_NATPI|nr:Yip1 family protein [Natronoarchaeum philippinense]SNZ17064.1 Yip1 domain-containing protein [Natronoarchaeum philippinense]